MKKFGRAGIRVELKVTGKELLHSGNYRVNEHFYLNKGGGISF